MARILALMAWAALAQAATLEEAVRDVARRLNANLARGEAYALQFRPGPAPPNEVNAARRVLLQSLRIPGPGEARCEVVVTLSRNLESRLVVGEVRRGREVSAAVAPYDPASAARQGVVLSRHLFWEQADRLLDAAPIDGGWLVLDTQRLFVASEGRVVRSAAIAPSKPWPRDPRARLVVDGDRVSISAPDLRCAGAWRPDLRVTCEAAATEWTSGRNTLTASKLVAFARAPLGKQTLVAGADGKTRLHDASGAEAAVFPQWGSSIATLASPCGDGAIIVASNSAERSIQAFGLDNLQPRPLGEPMEFSGAISELTDSAGGLTALAATGTGSHAAYRVTADCGR